MNDRELPGRLIAAGRAADVYDAGDGTVHKRYRTADAGPDDEARVMRFVAERGFPVPEVREVDGRDLVMSKVDGPTMAEDLRRRPARALGHARLLARLQRALAQVPAPDWLMAPGWTPDPTGDRVLHLDLQPANVVLALSGPVVIDWRAAAAGPPGFDAATSYVAMVTHKTHIRSERIAQRVMSDTFRRARGKLLVDAFVLAACDHRLADPLLPPDERVEVGALRSRVRT